MAAHGSSHVHLVLLMVVITLGLAPSTLALIVNTTTTACSNTCESKDCSDPFTLRYGKYCGVGYTGCSGAAPCDGLDLCCQTHDNCIGSNIENYVNRTCNGNLETCVKIFKNSGAATFSGANCSVSEVEAVIITAMSIATVGSSSPPLLFKLHFFVMAVLPLSVSLLCS